MEDREMMMLVDGATATAPAPATVPVVVEMREMVTVRAATEDDIPTIAAFQVENAMESEGSVLSQETVEKGIRNLLNNPIRGVYYVACVGESIAGCTMTTFEWDDWRNSNHIWIQSVFVAKPFRRMGVFGTLYRHIEKEARASGAVSLRLLVDRGNEVAKRTYSRLGMAQSHYDIYDAHL
eukprot:EC795102.1.p1 GENE.EC795102.1~~EC795102.1.p1  ORF type:complete len:180 (+),score=57.35 EC795102.1:105-644(+)